LVLSIFSKLEPTKEQIVSPLFERRLRFLRLASWYSSSWCLSATDKEEILLFERLLLACPTSRSAKDLELDLEWPLTISSRLRASSLQMLSAALQQV
jgi:hypothetical protein